MPVQVDAPALGPKVNPSAEVRVNGPGEVSPTTIVPAFTTTESATEPAAIVKLPTAGIFTIVSLVKFKLAAWADTAPTRDNTATNKPNFNLFII